MVSVGPCAVDVWTVLEGMVPFTVATAWGDNRNRLRSGLLSTMKWLRGWRGLLDGLGDRLVTGSIRWIRVHDSWDAVVVGQMEKGGRGKVGLVTESLG